MSISQKNLLQILAVSAVAMGLAACGPNDGKTAGQKLDNTINQTEQAAEIAKADADRAVEAAGKTLENAVDATKDALTHASAATQTAASHAANSIGEASVTAKVNAALIGDSALRALKIHVDTQGSTVTLQGQAPSQAAKDRAEQLAKAVEGVQSVNNLLTVQ